jgi:hypothetical protein
MPRQRPDRPVNIPLRRRAATTFDVILGIMAAVATALLMGLIARDAIGMPPVIVREDALIAASVMIAAMAGMSSHKRKQ